jgi:small subunit ribosomal protein S17
MSHLEKRKVKEGLVVGDKMDKTVVVAVETRKVHPLYKKAIRGTKNIRLMTRIMPVKLETK